jgi:hypothetical protein
MDGLKLAIQQQGIPYTRKTIIEFVYIGPECRVRHENGAGKRRYQFTMEQVRGYNNISYIYTTSRRKPMPIGYKALVATLGVFWSKLPLQNISLAPSSK